MNKRAILGLMLAILLPLTGYYLVKYYSANAIQMPRRYFYDSVAVVEKNGKLTNDTIWHHVNNINFVNQLGKKVSLDSLKGKILVVNFFFSRCPSICPGLARNMKKLQDSYANSKDSIVQFISVSIDPVHDSVLQLRNFADKFTFNHDSWWFVTGDRKEIYDFALKEMKASVADTEVDSAFIHTENFFLLDKERIVRGWYNGFDTVKQAQLVKDIPLLMLEKTKKRSFGQFLKELFGG
jgi:protein SCO1/2